MPTDDSAMNAALFPNSETPPSEAGLRAVLGRADACWRALIDALPELAPNAVGEWKFYKSSGWMFLLRRQKRNLLYLRPQKNAFLASTALAEAAYAAALESDLPEDLLAELRAAPKYPEGRPARVTVRKKSDVQTVLTLLALKTAK